MSSSYIMGKQSALFLLSFNEHYIQKIGLIKVFSLKVPPSLDLIKIISIIFSPDLAEVRVNTISPLSRTTRLGHLEVTLSKVVNVTFLYGRNFLFTVSRFRRASFDRGSLAPSLQLVLGRSHEGILVAGADAPEVVQGEIHDRDAAEPLGLDERGLVAGGVRVLVTRPDPLLARVAVVGLVSVAAVLLGRVADAS